MISAAAPAWLERAACAGQDPALFASPYAEDAREALALCRSCPVTQECEDWVRPSTSSFDGVCAGLVWVNGSPRPLRRPVPLDAKALKRAGWSEDAVRKAHALWVRGTRSEAIAEGERIYQALRHQRRTEDRRRENARSRALATRQSA